jgi:hypothetical protein
LARRVIAGVRVGLREEISSGSGNVISGTGQLTDVARKIYVEFTINIYKDKGYIGRCCVLFLERPSPQRNDSRTRSRRSVLSCFRCGLSLVAHFRHTASIIAINGLTGSLINTCYDRLRSVQNTTTDLKPTIALLRNLNDVPTASTWQYMPRIRMRPYRHPCRS